MTYHILARKKGEKRFRMIGNNGALCCHKAEARVYDQEDLDGALNYLKLNNRKLEFKARKI